MLVGCIYVLSYSLDIGEVNHRWEINQSMGRHYLSISLSLAIRMP